MSAPLLEIAGLTVSYGGAPALHGFDMSAGAGECVALLGANGAGKSTLLRALMGLTPATGRILFEGHDISALPPQARAKRGMSYVPEGRRIFAGMTVRENLEVASRAGRRMRQQDMARIFEIFPQLAARPDENAWKLSGGQQQMLAIGRALMPQPRLLLMDEPSLGLAPAIATTVMAALSGIVAAGTAIVMAEQNARLALAAAGRVVILERGRAGFRGSADELRARPDILTSAVSGQGQGAG